MDQRVRFGQKRSVFNSHTCVLSVFGDPKNLKWRHVLGYHARSGFFPRHIELAACFKDCVFSPARLVFTQLTVTNSGFQILRPFLFSYDTAGCFDGMTSHGALTVRLLMFRIKCHIRGRRRVYHRILYRVLDITDGCLTDAILRQWLLRSQ